MIIYTSICLYSEEKMGFIPFVIVLILFIKATERKTFVIDGDIENIYTQTKSIMSLWKKGNIANIDSVNHALEVRTKMSLYSFGERVKIQFIALDHKRVQINVTSILNLGPWDTWEVNLQNIKQFEEIMGLEPSVATHTAQNITF